MRKTKCMKQMYMKSSVKCMVPWLWVKIGGGGGSGGTYDHIMKKVKFDIFSCTIRVVGDIVVHCYYVHKC